MGNNPSKSQSAPSTPVKAAAPKDEQMTGQIDEQSPPPPPSPTQLIDPRSPNINRTPLTDVVPRFGRSSNAQTPTAILRNRLMRDIEHKYTENEMCLLDPRSPTVNVPRTPIQFLNKDSYNGDISSTNDQHYCSLDDSHCIEEASCRAFNEKISNITLDDSDYEEQNLNTTLELECIRRKYLETHFDVADSNEDPRSPSTNVLRTPIILPAEGKVSTVPVDIKTDIKMKVDDEKISGLEEETKIDDNDDEIIVSNLPISSSTPTVPPVIAAAAAAAATTTMTSESLATAINLEKIKNNQIYEDDEKTDPVTKNGENAIVMTPVRKFIQKNNGNVAANNKPRTPLSVLNRRTKSAESMSQKQSRLQHLAENENAFQHNSKIGSGKKTEIDENFTPKSSNVSNKNQATNRRSQSRIPVFKK